MWHEARKQEKKIRGMIVDYRKRAERRREFYEKFKADPTQFIQIHGRQCRVHMDPTITTAADNSLMPWQGNKETIIDRFDVRAHLDYIPESNRQTVGAGVLNLDADVDNLGELNYERYRILVQNEITNVSEDKFLHQIHLEEQYGTTSILKENKSSKHLVQPKAAIAYTYEDEGSNVTTQGHAISKAETNEDESDDDLDFDLLVNVNDLTILQKVELNNSGEKFGLNNTEFMTYLTNDVKERENYKLMKLQEEEKQALSGRKAKRERRAYKDRHLPKRDNWSPLSYAASALEQPDETKSSSDSEFSNSPDRVTFITSFGPKSNDPIGPNLPSAYSGRKREKRKKRRGRWDSSRSRSSSSDEWNKRRKKSRRKGGKQRKRSSSSSSSSSSTSSSSEPSVPIQRKTHKSPTPPEPPVKRYYGRHHRNSHSESNSSDEAQKKSSPTQESSAGEREKVTINSSSKVVMSGGRDVGVGNSNPTKLTPQERLKLRMQIALNKQLKADKEAEKVRLERIEQERMDREESLREITIKYRKKERERRHGELGDQDSNSSESQKSRSRSRSVSGSEDSG